MSASSLGCFRDDHEGSRFSRSVSLPERLTIANRSHLRFRAISRQTHSVKFWCKTSNEQMSQDHSHAERTEVSGWQVIYIADEFDSFPGTSQKNVKEDPSRNRAVFQARNRVTGNSFPIVFRRFAALTYILTSSSA